jgi:probable F420-dependent oxidoreductase
VKFGLFSLNFDACSYPETAARVAREAEAAGFESLWVGDRLLAPDPRIPGSPVDPTDRMLDPIVALAFLAGQTSRALLGTGVIVLPQRQPLVLAKQLASLDALANGRLIAGIGVGYLEPELRAAGVPLRERGARTDEYLAAMRAIWSEDAPTFEGRFVSFSGLSAHPRRAGIPIVVGGQAPAALRRTVEQANGWFGFGMDLDETAGFVNQLKAIASRVDRPASLGPLEITVSTRGRVTRDLAEQYVALGVDRIVLLPRRHADEATLLRFVENAARELLAADA